MEEQHLNLTSPTPSGTHSHIGLLDVPFGLNQQMALPGNMVFHQRVHGKHPFFRWAEDNDAPWHPPGLTAGAEDDNDQSMLRDIQEAQFIVQSQANVNVVSSEIMGQSDSGYGSYGNHHSIANGSICDDSFDPNVETQSVMGGPIGGRFVDASFPTSNAMSKDVTTLSGSWTNQITLETLKCEECGKAVKTKSELKKHDQRHKKPYKCDVKQCTRNEGFSTPNDLARHKASKHPETTTGNRYVCTIGPCKTKRKIWPRSDNFKCHLKRVHKEESVSTDNLAQYIYKDLTLPDEHQDNVRQDIVSHFNEYSGLANGQTSNWPLIGVSHDMNSLESPSDAQGEEDISLSPPQGTDHLHILRAAPQQGLYQEAAEAGAASYSPITSSSHMQHNQLPREPEAPETALPSVKEQITQAQGGYYAESHVPGVNASKLSVLDESREEGSGNSPIQTLPDHLLKTDSVTSDAIKPEDISGNGTESFNLDFSNTIEMKKLVERLQSHGVLEQLGYKKESSEEAVDTKTEDDLATNQNPTASYSCTTCRKSFPRRCELKKHEKRHEKPYACTMPDCHKRFGSKNDWKRHENTQHFMVESWRCDEERCEAVYYHREQFKAHLEKDHQIGDQSQLEAKLEQCRVGQNCEARFWCGYCEKIIEIKEKGHQARNERFDHIGDHLSGRNGATKDVSEWKDPDPSQRSKELLKDAPGHSKHKRKRGDSNTPGNSKRNRMVTSQGLVCCLCGDLVTVSQVRCNFPCEHIPCDNCRG
ncbi:hypothetical protein O1611_g401 [Lasiodiplodia mahajangana]|uniref:Uncharacterized protein n=1 Tax=Lasiodiplodia mahajangana TaxID=1108764 RepID=A0ACC2K0J7_9PEZI|nr:hypothetical protein O1611_g401 [Lasiodiplodia mahajangana]